MYRELQTSKNSPVFWPPCMYVVDWPWGWVKSKLNSRLNKTMRQSRLCNLLLHTHYNNNNNNKCDQSNFGREPCPGTVAHVYYKVPNGYNGVPQIRPQKYPFPWTNPQTALPASSLNPSNLRCQTASRSDPPFFHNALDRPTHVRTDRSFTGKFDRYRPLCSNSNVA